MNPDRIRSAAMADYDDWCASNPGECVLCNPHVCDDYCQNCEEFK